MNKYIVKDWAGNVMEWGEFSDEYIADEYIAKHVLKEMSNDGVAFDENVFYSYSGEYFIEEVFT